MFSQSGNDWDKGKDRNLRIFLVSIAISCITPAFARAMDVFRHPEFPGLFTSLFEEPRNVSLPFKLLIAYAHMHMNAYHYMNFSFNLMTMIYYNYGFVSMMSALVIKDTPRKLTGTRLVTTTKRIARSHRELYHANCIQ